MPYPKKKKKIVLHWVGLSDWKNNIIIIIIIIIMHWVGFGGAVTNKAKTADPDNYFPIAWLQKET